MKITGRSWGLPCYVTEQAWVLLAFEFFLDGGGFDDFPCTYTIGEFISYLSIHIFSLVQCAFLVTRISSDRCFHYPAQCKRVSVFTLPIPCLVPQLTKNLELTLNVSESRISSLASHGMEMPLTAV